MYKRGALTSIPEIDAEEESGKKWVPKKKHEVLKAKYKCLKKLFQIYDASVIGILPEQAPESGDETKSTRRRKRSHRTKTDACAGTNELSNGDNTISEYDNSSVATAIIRELNIDQSCISTQVDSKIDKYAETIDSHESSEHNCPDFGTCHCRNPKDIRYQELPYPRIPYLVLNEKRRLTRFQCFVQRLFGIRRENYNVISGDKMHAVSDPTLTFREKRRRRGLRFRRLRRPKKVKSEGALRDLKSPNVLSCIQSVQRNCLMDMTPRQCPIVGCNMISYGIINYNDHLNLCHFQEKKDICHYCHKGFDTQYEKQVHENEHIGVGRLDNLASLPSFPTAGKKTKIASDTQTEPEMKIPEEKLKKIVSFFDKISDPDQMLSEIKKNRNSETNLRSTKPDTDSNSGSESSQKTRTISCCNMRRKTETQLCSSVAESDLSSRHTPATVICHYCGEHFKYRRQLSLHVDLEHRVHNKFTKYHSCAGIVTSPHVDMTSEDGSIRVHSVNHSSSRTESLQGVLTPSTMTVETALQGKSEASLSCDPSTNIVYYTSVESLQKPSMMDSLVKKVRSYRWEPGTKIIRV